MSSAPAQLPANLRAPVLPMPRPSPKLCSNPRTCPPGSQLNPRRASTLHTSGFPERAQASRPRPSRVLGERAAPLASKPAGGRGAPSTPSPARLYSFPWLSELAAAALALQPRRKRTGQHKTLLVFKSSPLGLLWVERAAGLLWFETEAGLHCWSPKRP